MVIPIENTNIVVNQITIKGTFKEVIPLLPDPSIENTLIRDEKGNLMWKPYISTQQPIKYSDSKIIVNGKIKDTNIHYENGRIGIDRKPLLNYKFDIAVPPNKLMTAFHVGDGKYGFSMGNGTNNGFVPEIIGMGSSEEDAGLYFIGRAGNALPSNIPLIVLDARSVYNDSVSNRPILGIKTGRKNVLILDHQKMEIDGVIKAKDFIIDSSISLKDLISIIIEQKIEIKTLKDEIDKLKK
jgi:hypothetical protein